jgi:hypothetical protein
VFGCDYGQKSFTLLLSEEMNDALWSVKVIIPLIIALLSGWQKTAIKAAISQSVLHGHRSDIGLQVPE